MLGSKSTLNLEKKVAKSIQEAYSQGDYIRCYNLLKVMNKINNKNPVFLKYVVKLDEKKILNYRKKWALGGTGCFMSLLKSPKLFLTFFFLYFLGRLK